MAKKDEISTTWEVLGWIGTFLIVLAYGLNRFGQLAFDSPIYQSMNLLGAALVGYIVWRRRAYQALALQLVWGVVAIVALVGMLLR